MKRIDQEISNLLTDNKEYRVQDHLYQNNEVYQRVLHSACYDAFMNEEFDPKQSCLWIIRLKEETMRCLKK